MTDYKLFTNILSIIYIGICQMGHLHVSKGLMSNS